MDMKIIVLNMCAVRDISPLADIHIDGYESSQTAKCPQGFVAVVGRIPVQEGKNSLRLKKLIHCIFVTALEILMCFLSDYIILCLFSASLSGTNPETIYIFSHEATAQFISDYSENYNGFNATYTTFNASELNSKYSFFVCVFVCYPESLMNLYFQFDESIFSV